MKFIVNTVLRAAVVVFCAWMGWLTLGYNANGAANPKQTVVSALVVGGAFTFFAHFFELDDEKEDIVVMGFVGAAILGLVATFLPHYVAVPTIWIGFLCGVMIGAAQIPFESSSDQRV